MHEYVIEGKVHYLDGEYNDALDALYKYLELSSKTGEGGSVDDMMNAYIMLGNIHLAFSEYVRAAITRRGCDAAARCSRLKTR